MSIEFIAPEFLQGQSVDEIQKKMLDGLPDDMDKSEGQYLWQFCIGTATEKSEMIQFQLLETLKLIYPQFAYGIWLDLHGATRGLPRNAATYAVGNLFITVSSDTVIPLGFTFSTEATSNTSNIIFEATEEAVIPETGIVSVPIQAITAGVQGNVITNTITLMVNPIKEITSITNSESLSGGTEEENDDNYRERILEYDTTQGSSFIGNVSDYERWATDGTGVRLVSVTPPDDDTGIIKIALLETTSGDAITSGDPEPYRTRVINKIMSPDNPSLRLAPVNAQINVVGSTAVNIYVKANIETDGTRTISQITSDFVEKLKGYYKTAINQGEVRYSVICSLLTLTAGLYDYNTLLIKSNEAEYGTDNIMIAQYEAPLTNAESVVFTEI